jgi:hypothetical protein
MRPSLLETTQRKNEVERRLGFRPALQRWRRQQHLDLWRSWKPPPLTCFPPRPLADHLTFCNSSSNSPLSTAASSSLGRSCSGDSRLFPSSSKVFPCCPALDPCLCLSSFIIVQVFSDAAVSHPPIVLQVFLDCGTSSVD